MSAIFIEKSLQLPGRRPAVRNDWFEIRRTCGSYLVLNLFFDANDQPIALSGLRGFHRLARQYKRTRNLASVSRELGSWNNLRRFEHSLVLVEVEQVKRKKPRYCRNCGERRNPEPRYRV
jgi:hypothetical protein